MTPDRDDRPPWDPVFLRKSWEALGAHDPLWAVLAAPESAGGAWDDDAFWETGRQQVRAVMAFLEGQGVRFERGRMLDFGCGVGRLSAPFAEHFAMVVGLDAARTMIDGARSRNPAGRRARYVHSANPAL